MKRNVRRWWILALEKEEARAYRNLGICYLTGNCVQRDKRVGKACLRKAMEMGDERSFFLYNKWFERGKKVIDDRSYEEMVRDWRRCEDARERRRLERYLQLGTRKQKRKYLVTVHR